MQDSFWKMRLAFCRRFPYLTRIAMSLVPVAVEGIGTVTVDKHWRIYYDPDYIEQLAPEDRVALMYHMVLHLARRHSERLPWAEVELRNLCADLEVNDDVKRDVGACNLMLVMPEHFGFPDNETMEYYAELISRNKLPCPSSGPDAGEDSDGGGDGEPDGSSMPRCGSGGGGKPEEYELAEGQAAPAISEMEQESILKQVADDIQRYRGRIPQHWHRWAGDKLKPPTVNWRRELRSAMSHSVAEVLGVDDFSYLRPNRRQAVYGKVIMPCMVSRRPKVAIAVDTSVSIRQHELVQAVSEVLGVARALGEQPYVVTCDAEVKKVARTASPDKLIQMMIGGGGTDMRVAIAKCLDLIRGSGVLVVITDCETPWPDSIPAGVKLVVARHATSSCPAPSYARVVEVGHVCD